MWTVYARSNLLIKRNNGDQALWLSWFLSRISSSTRTLSALISLRWFSRMRSLLFAVSDDHLFDVFWSVQCQKLRNSRRACIALSEISRPLFPVSLLEALSGSSSVSSSAVRSSIKGANARNIPYMKKKANETTKLTCCLPFTFFSLPPCVPCLYLWICALFIHRPLCIILHTCCPSIVVF